MILSVGGLSFRRGGERVILDNIGFELAPGDILSLLGPNGAGKTTLLRCVLALLRPDAGVVRLGGRDLHTMTGREVALHIAYVPQASQNTLPFKVAELVLMGRTPHLRVLDVPSRADRAKALATLDGLGIGHLAERSMAQISGGERQIALIARALAQQARILVLDEPTASLDYGNQIRVLETIAGIARRGHAVLMSTHSPDHALMLGGHAALLREARFLAHGPVNDVLTAERLSTLYGTPIAVVTQNVGGRSRRICIPSFDNTVSGRDTSWSKTAF